MRGVRGWVFGGAGVRLSKSRRVRFATFADIRGRNWNREYFTSQTPVGFLVFGRGFKGPAEAGRKGLIWEASGASSGCPIFGLCPLD